MPIRIRWLITGLLVTVSMMAAGTPGADAPRVAVLDFERAGMTGSLEPELADLSRSVQTKLIADAGFAWVERQELERLTREMTRQPHASATSAVRLGQLLRADLVLRGEVRTEEDRGELKLEVIDLKRADLLAHRTVPLTIGRTRRLAPSAADLGRAGEAALAALTEARAALQKIAGLRVVAPLYFKNVSRTGRLDFAEERLAAAVVRAAVPEKGFHLLSFPQTTAARGESELVLAGLTDTNPEAWQQVADAYLWATVEEKAGAGPDFDNTPVTITLTLWNGFAPPVETKWQGAVRDLDAGIATVVTDGLRGLVLPVAGGPRDPAERNHVAAEMYRRSRDMAARLQGSQFNQFGVARGVSAEDFARSAEGRRIQAHELRLLEIALFFKPQDAELQQNLRNTLAYYGVSRHAGPTGLSAAWPRLQELRQRWQASLQSGGPPDAEVAQELLKLHDRMGSLVNAGPIRWYDQGPELTPAERRTQVRQLAEQWLDDVTSVNRAFAGSTVPAWIEQANRNQLYALRNHVANLEIMPARTLLDSAWPVLKVAAGQVLRTAPENPSVDPREGLAGMVFSVAYAFGDNDRALAMLDEAWQASVPPAAAERPSKVRRVRTIYDVHYTVPERWGQSVAASGPALSARIREIEPWPKVLLRQDLMDREAPLRKVQARIVDALAWHQGRLWIAESGRVALPPELGLKNPEGDHYLWSYDPAMQLAESATARLESHTTIRSLLSQGENLWLGFDGAGLWRWNPDDGPVRRFKGEDGLLSMRIMQAQARPEALTFLGGEPQKPVLLRYDPVTGGWSGMGNLPAGGYAALRRMAVLGDWLAYANDGLQFYNFRSKEWKRLLKRPIATGVESASMDPRYLISVLEADDRGFWFGRDKWLRFLDPQAPEQQPEIAIPGYPLALAHSGPWLWVLVDDNPPPAANTYVQEEKVKPSRLLLIDKRSLAVMGTLVLPAAEMRHLVVADGRVWVGGSTILEIDPVLPEQPLAEGPAATALTSLPLHRAAARSDRATVGKALQAGHDVNAKAANGWTPLMSAAARGRTENVKRLLTAGADPNLVAADHTTALQLAADRADVGLVKILLAAGARPDPANPPPPLAGQIGLSFPVIVPPAGASRPAPTPLTPADLTLGRPVPAEYVDWNKTPGQPAYPYLTQARSALMAAALQDSAELVDLLVAAGARPDLADHCGRTALQLAVRHGKDAAVRALLARGANPARADGVGATALTAAYLRHESEALLRALIAAVPETDRRAAVSQLLYMAAQSGRVEDLPLLRTLGGDVDARQQGGESVLSGAIYTEQQATVAWLLANGVKVGTAAPAVFQEVFNLILSRDDAKVLEQLLAAGLDANHVHNRKPLLVHAIAANKPGLVATLKARGADLTLRTNGKLPVEFADSDEMRALLHVTSAAAGWIGPRWEDYQRGPRIQYRTKLISGQPGDTGVLVPEPTIPPADLQLLQACAAGDLERARQAVAAGASLDCRDEEGGTPLTHALKQKALPLARWLVSQGASVNYYTKMANFPITFAAESGVPEAVDLLLEAGASPNVDGVGLTPLMVAVQNRDRPMTEKLLAAGGDPNLCGGGDRSWRMNPLAEALLTGDEPMVELLLAHGANPRATFEYYHRKDVRDEPRRQAPSLLMWAAKGGNVTLLRRMIALGQDPKYQTVHGGDALGWAAEEGRTAAVEFLLPISPQRGEALKSARAKGLDQIVQLLEAAGYQSR